MGQRARRRTLLSRLITAYLVLTLVLLGAFAFFAHYLGKRSLDSALGQRLVSIAQSTAAQVLPEVFSQIAPGDEEGRAYTRLRRKLLDLQAKTSLARIELLDREGRIRVDTESDVPIGAQAFELATDHAEIASALGGHAAASVLFRGRDGRSYKRGYAPLLDEGGGQVLGVVATWGSAAYFRQLEQFRRWLIVYGALGAIMVIAVSAAIAGRITRPLRELAARAERIGQGDLAEAIAPLRSRDELAQLAETLEEMRRHLAARDERMQMMLAGIAHEVRNPLGGIELFAGLLREDLAGDPPKLEHLARIERELGRLKEVVADFLDFSRRPKPALAELDCRALLEEVRDVLRKDATEAQIVCAVESAGTPRALADGGQIRRAVLNLARNAIQATPPGGRVRLACENGDDRVRIAVIDSGPGIAAAAMPQIFMPFFTTKERGTGLGLAFVRDIVRDHGGSVEVQTQPGQGSTFTIELPTWPKS